MKKHYQPEDANLSGANYALRFLKRARIYFLLNAGRRLTQLCCVLIMTSLLITSNHAAVPITVGAAIELNQDVVFFVGHNQADWKARAADSVKFVFNFIFGGEESGDTAARQVTRIRVSPNNIKVGIGEKINFVATALNANDATVSAVSFAWKSGEQSVDGLSAINERGEFAPTFPGTYTISAEAEGVTGEAVVMVVESTLSPTDRKPVRSEIREVSTQTGTSTVIETNEPKTLPVTNGDPSMNLPEPGNIDWNNGNWSSLSNPGNQTGNPPGHQVDNGALSNNFQFAAPILTLAGRGIGLTLNLAYNARMWNKSGNNLTYDIDRGSPAPGWNLGFGKMIYVGSQNGCVIVDAEGTRHGYYGKISTRQYPTGSATGFSGYTTDGTMIDYSCGVSLENGNMSGQGYATLSNGTTIQYSAINNSQMFPTFIQDAHGNYISISYRSVNYQWFGPSIDTIKDNLGRDIVFNYDSNNRLISITAPGLNGAPRDVVRLNYRQINLDPSNNYGFASNIATYVRDNNPYVLNAIYYPESGTGYCFGDANSTDYYSYYGMIAKVVEQRGMTFTPGAAGTQGTINPGQMTKQTVYNYPLTANNTLTDSPSYTTQTSTWDGMDTAEAVTTYEINNSDTFNDGTNNIAARSITVTQPPTATQPNGVKNKQYTYKAPNLWYDGLVISDKTFVMNGSNEQIFGSSRVEWQQGYLSTPVPSKNWVTDDSGQTIRTEFDYTNGIYNQVTKTCQYGYSNNRLQCERTGYENRTEYIGTRTETASEVRYTGNHIFNLIRWKELSDENDVRVSRVEYEYDNNYNPTLNNHNLTPAVGVIMHDPSYDPHTTQTYTYCTSWGAWYCCDGLRNKSKRTAGSGNGTINENGTGTDSPGDCPDGSPPTCRDCNQYATASVFRKPTMFRGNLTKIKSFADVQAAALAGEVSQTMQYDITGNKTGESNSPAERTTFAYSVNNQFAYPETVTFGSSDVNSPHRVSTSTTYDFNTGLALTKTDAKGRTATTEYDATSLHPVKNTLPTGGSSIYQYDDVQMTIVEEAHENPDANNPSPGRLAGKSIKYLNGLGKVRKEAVAGTNNTWENEVATVYDELGRIRKQSRPYRIGVETPQWTTNSYDALGRIFKTEAADGSTSQAFYNETPRPDSATNSPGKIIRSVDPWGRERWARHDERDRLVEVVEPNPNGSGSVFAAGSLPTKYVYNAQNNLIETIQGAQHRYFAYDSLGRLVRQKLSEQSATLNANGEYVGTSGSNPIWSEAYAYDERSILIQKTDARGVKTFYDYLLPDNSEDPLRRLSAIRYNTSATDSSRPIHAASNVAFEYETSGDKTAVKKVSTGFSTEDYSYDAEGRLKDYILTVNNRPTQPMTSSYDYDSLNRVTKVTYPKQYGSFGNPRKAVNYSFDMVSRMSELQYDNQQRAGDFVFNAAGQATSVKIGTGASQITEEYSFDAQTGLLSNQQIRRASGEKLLDLSYEYRRRVNGSLVNGRSGQVTETTNNLDLNKNRAYEYDKLGRLASVTGGINQTWSQTYIYDRYGNRTNVAVRGVEALRSAAAQVKNTAPNVDAQKQVANTNATDSPTLSILPPTTGELVERVNGLVKNSADNSELKERPADENSPTDAEKNQSSETTDTDFSVLKNQKDSLPKIGDDTAPNRVLPNNIPFDFDGDNTADLSTWHRLTGVWTIRQSSNNQTTTMQVGTGGNQIVPADYDGDGLTDRAVWNPANGVWTIRRSTTGVVYTVSFGQVGDAVVPADYDGDNKADIAVWRASIGTYYVLRSTDGGVTYFSWGNGNTLGDIPVVGDYDNDGRADFIVWRPCSGSWFIMKSSNGQFEQPGWGQTGDVPVPADYDGNGSIDLAVWRPSTGVWFIYQIMTGQYLAFALGSDTQKDMLAPADFDGDGKADAAVWNSATGVWTIRQSSTGNFVTQTLGASGEMAVPSAYIRRSSAPKGQNVNVPRDGLENVAYDALTNRITNNTNFEYDVMGNLVKALAPDGTTVLRYEYDAANRLKIVAKVATNQELQRFSYGSDNRRLAVEELTNGTATVYGWAGKSSIIEYSTADLPNQTHGLTWSKSYVFSGDQLLMTTAWNGARNESISYHHPDRLGTRIITDPITGSFTEQTTLPFGNVMGSETSGTSNRVFTSYDRSNLTGLDYAVNRTYDAGQGRFTQIDPIGMQAVSKVSPQTLNLYTYCGNDPVNHTDPDGLFFGKLFRWLGKIFKFLALVVTVVIAILAIVAASTATGGLAGLGAIKLLALIGKVAAAISDVLDYLGFSKVAAVFGIISAYANFGSSLGTVFKKLSIKSILGLIAKASALVSKVLSAAGYTKLSQIFDLIGAVAGFDPEWLQDKVNAKEWWAIFKYARKVAVQIATVAGATQLVKVLGFVGIVEDIYDIQQALFSDSLKPDDQKLANAIGKLPLIGSLIGKYSNQIFRTLLFIRAFNGYIGKINSILPPEKKPAQAANSSAPGAISTFLQPAY